MEEEEEEEEKDKKEEEKKEVLTIERNDADILKIFEGHRNE